jgi:8-oxo-dGTP diphosphatase
MKQIHHPCFIDNCPVLPRVAVGAVVRHNNSFLLVKRANEPSRGRWAIPGGKIKLGETLQEAAQREVFEETGVNVRALEPVLTFDLIERDTYGTVRFHYIIVDLLAQYISGGLVPGGDALEVVWAKDNDLEKYNLSPATLDLFHKNRF